MQQFPNFMPREENQGHSSVTLGNELLSSVNERHTKPPEGHDSRSQSRALGSQDSSMCEEKGYVFQGPKLLAQSKSMSDAEKAIRERYLSDIPTTPRYGSAITQLQLPHSNDTKPFDIIGPSNHGLRPWILPPGIPSSTSSSRSSPSTPTDSTQTYLLHQNHANQAATLAAAAAAAHHRQIYALNLPRPIGNTSIKSTQHHLIQEPMAKANVAIPSALSNRAQAAPTGNLCNRSPPSAGSMFFHPERLNFTPSSHQLPKHRMTYSPPLSTSPKVGLPSSYYYQNHSHELYASSSMIQNQHQSQFHAISQYDSNIIKSEVSRSISSRRTPDYNKCLLDNAIRHSLPPPAIPIFPPKGNHHNQAKEKYLEDQDQNIFAPPLPPQPSPTSPPSLPSTLTTLSLSSATQASITYCQSPSNSTYCSQAHSLQPNSEQLKEQKNDSFEPTSTPLIRHRRLSEANSSHEKTVTAAIDSISNPFSEYAIGKDNDTSDSDEIQHRHTSDGSNTSNKGTIEILPIKEPCHSWHSGRHFLNHTSSRTDTDPFSLPGKRNLSYNSRNKGHMEETGRNKEKIEDKEGGDYPVHFTAGSLIQLSSGALRPVEDLNTDDFIKSAELSKEVQIDQSVVVNISPSKQKGLVMLEFSVGKEEVQVAVEAAIEHPFYVFNQGWCSVNPKCTMDRYQLPCHKLNVGDVCISLTHRDTKPHAQGSSEHINVENAAPITAEMSRLQPIKLIQENDSCQSSCHIVQKQTSKLLVEESDEKCYKSPSPSRNDDLSPRSKRDSCNWQSSVSSSQTYHSVEVKKETDAIDKIQSKTTKPPPARCDIGCSGQRRSHSLSPTFSQPPNQVSSLLIKPCSTNQTTKDRQVVFNDNIISHSPPSSPYSNHSEASYCSTSQSKALSPDEHDLKDIKGEIAETKHGHEAFPERETVLSKWETNLAEQRKGKLTDQPQNPSSKRMRLPMDSSSNIYTPTGQSCSPSFPYSITEENDTEKSTPRFGRKPINHYSKDEGIQSTSKHRDSECERRYLGGKSSPPCSYPSDVVLSHETDSVPTANVEGGATKELDAKAGVRKRKEHPNDIAQQSERKGSSKQFASQKILSAFTQQTKRDRDSNKGVLKSNKERNLPTSYSQIKHCNDDATFNEDNFRDRQKCDKNN